MSGRGNFELDIKEQSLVPRAFGKYFPLNQTKKLEILHQRVLKVIAAELVILNLPENWYRESLCLAQ